MSSSLAANYSTSLLQQLEPAERTCNHTLEDRGQRTCRQINNADALLAAFALVSRKLAVRNGYLMTQSAKPLRYFAKQVRQDANALRAEALLKVGVHEHTQARYQSRTCSCSPELQ